MKDRDLPRHEKRAGGVLKEKVHDPYRAGEKPHEELCCPGCGVQYRSGRWVWATKDAGELKQQSCPACRRISDNYPAGEFILSGGFLGAHRDEILATIRHIEETERSEHPLNRIMSIEDKDDVLTIRTTDLHLPHRIAHALKDAWGGEMKTHYDTEGCFTRVQWERNT